MVPGGVVRTPSSTRAKMHLWQVKVAGVHRPCPGGCRQSNQSSACRDVPPDEKDVFQFPARTRMDPCSRGESWGATHAGGLRGTCPCTCGRGVPAVVAINAAHRRARGCQLPCSRPPPRAPIGTNCRQRAMQRAPSPRISRSRFYGFWPTTAPTSLMRGI